MKLPEFPNTRSGTPRVAPGIVAYGWAILLMTSLEVLVILDFPGQTRSGERGPVSYLLSTYLYLRICI
jgi:hypothetical protein